MYQHFGGLTTPVTFQIRLYSNGDIQIHFKNFDISSTASGPIQTIGTNSGTGSGTQVHKNSTTSNDLRSTQEFSIFLPTWQWIFNKEFQINVLVTLESKR